jgi:CRISPR/Cas system CSM-associated protein Csm3 (group 7 of RAMP superfamily)
MIMRTHLHVARLTLECATPLSIGTGGSDEAFDVQLVRDANGLPAIPGSSLAGVMRHVYARHYGDGDAARVFGFQSGADGQVSTVEVSWGCIQDSSGRAIEGLLLGEARSCLTTDPLLKFARDTIDAPLIRERVRINHHGSAADRGKFDRAILPAGYRFSAEIAMWSDGGEQATADWNRLLDTLSHPEIRLGGATRSGLGATSIQSIHEKVFDLPKEREAFSRLSRSVGDPSALVLRTRTTTSEGQPFTFTLQLEPRHFWRIGQGDQSLTGEAAEKEADDLPRLERRVVWTDGTGTLSGPADWLLVPWSAIKGALSHRVAFHHNRLTGAFIEDLTPDAMAAYDKSESSVAVRDLFGFARNDRRKGGQQREGHAGRVVADDVYVRLDPRRVRLLTHNAIDRFTGGVRKHLLFSEEAIWGLGIEMKLLLFPARQAAEVDSSVEAALRLAIRDLASGRLSIGAGASDGHGFFEGNVLEVAGA